MVELSKGFAAMAALGLVAAAPASAATRAAQSLPEVSAQPVDLSLARASQPIVQASALANEDDDDNSTALIVGLVALLLAVLLAASGGGGGGPDSPG